MTTKRTISATTSPPTSPPQKRPRPSTPTPTPSPHPPLTPTSTTILTTTQTLLTNLSNLSQTYQPPVTHIYNPLTYAWAPHSYYIRKYASTPKKVLFVAMNPGPWGMVQSGIPFGDVSMVKDWFRLPVKELEVGRPERENGKRKVTGWDTKRGEVSGRRLWGWARERYGEDPMGFFRWAWVYNYCPLVWMGSSGRNITPVGLKKVERERVEMCCDKALKEVGKVLEPRIVVGIGGYAYEKVKKCLGDEVRVEKVLHPSPANPRASQTEGGWGKIVDDQLSEIFGDERLDVVEDLKN